MATKNQPPKVQNKPNDQAQQGQILATAQQWSGPLPPPGALQQFDAIIPNGAERIMVMVEQEQAHRISYEDKRLSAEIRDTKRGHLMGGSITVLAILAAAIGAYIGVHPAVCIAIVGLPIASMLRSIFGKK